MKLLSSRDFSEEVRFQTIVPRLMLASHPKSTTNPEAPLACQPVENWQQTPDAPDARHFTLDSDLP
jgi:hypothetical protein